MIKIIYDYLIYDLTPSPFGYSPFREEGGEMKKGLFAVKGGGVEAAEEGAKGFVAVAFTDVVFGGMAATGGVCEIHEAVVCFIFVVTFRKLLVEIAFFCFHVIIFTILLFTIYDLRD
jgi:hypothetical protein